MKTRPRGGRVWRGWLWGRVGGWGAEQLGSTRSERSCWTDHDEWAVALNGSWKWCRGTTGGRGSLTVSLREAWVGRCSTEGGGDEIEGFDATEVGLVDLVACDQGVQRSGLARLVG